jgi:thiamine-phosphate pyrophosphorylase
MTRPSDTLRRSRLYLVCEDPGDHAALAALLDGALSGGVDLIQLRDKGAADAQLLEAAPIFREAADRYDALFLINDRPDLVGPCEADGVHVGQDDTSVADARRTAGPDAIVGLSTHSPDQLRAALVAEGSARPDYISVGPVWATPTKPGRPAAGIDYVRAAAGMPPEAALPWFAIGGIDSSNIGAIVAAGAARVVVVRAIRDAADPAAAAAELRAALESPVGAGA